MRRTGWPSLNVNEKGTFLVQNANDTLFVYSDKGLMSQKIISNKARYKDGYIVDEVKGKLVVYPLDNLKDSIIVENKDKFVYEGYIKIDQIINKWMYYSPSSLGYTYLENIESNSSLINNSSYLTDLQKEELIKKLNK